MLTLDEGKFRHHSLKALSVAVDTVWQPTTTNLDTVWQPTTTNHFSRQTGAMWFDRI